MIICCNFCYDWYCLKINKSNLWVDLFNGPINFDIAQPKEGLPSEVAKSRYCALPGWFNCNWVVLIHLFLTYLDDAVKIAAEANSIDLTRCYHMSCRFVDSSWYLQQDDLKRKCEDCNSRLCLKAVCHHIFNVLYIFTIIDKEFFDPEEFLG